VTDELAEVDASPVDRPSGLAEDMEDNCLWAGYASGLSGEDDIDGVFNHWTAGVNLTEEVIGHSLGKAIDRCRSIIV
jgi:hypothetical protein